MKSELDADLCKRYPKIFRGRYDGNIQETLLPFGLEVGDGWYNILDAACGGIQQHIDWTRQNRARALRYNRALHRALRGDRRGLEHFRGFGEALNEWQTKMVEGDIAKARYMDVPTACEQVVAVQVKEKFGGLRFYINGGDKVVDGILRMAGAMSYRTCEVCGAPGKVYTDGWHVTLCATHAMEQGRGGETEEEDGNEAAV